MKKISKSYFLNFVLIFGLTLFALWFALKDHYQEVMNSLAQVRWYWFIIIIVWGIFYTVVIGLILTLLAREYKKDYTVKEGLVNGFVGAFFSGITPSATGGQFAQAYIFKKQGIKVSDGASLLYADFIIYQTTMIAYVTILFLLRFSYYYQTVSQFFIFILFGYFFNSSIIVLLWTMAKFPKVYMRLSKWAVKLLHKIHIIKDEQRTLEGWSIQLNAFTSEIKQLKDKKKLIFKAVLLNVLRLTVWFTLPYAVAVAIGVDMHLSMLVDVVAMSAFVSMANAFIPVPGASGGTELVFTWIFSATMMSAMQASSVMILWRFSTYHLILLIGGAVFIFAKRKYDHQKFAMEGENI